MVEPVEAAVARREARAAGAARARVFCPIWTRPWMAVGGDTYVALDLLELCGGENVFANRGDRRYPIVAPERDRRRRRPR